MLRRHPGTAFGGMWAFPGGVVEDTDALDADCGIAESDALRPPGPAAGGGAYSAAAARETLEETGLAVAVGDLVYLSHWITPEGSRSGSTRVLRRRRPRGRPRPRRARAHGQLLDPARRRVARHLAGDLDLIQPTLRNLEAVGRCATVAGSSRPPLQPDDPRAIDDDARVAHPPSRRSRTGEGGAHDPA